MDKKNNKNTRRDFIKKLGVLGAGTASAAAVYFNKNELLAKKSGNKIKVLTTDKRIVEVDASDITPVNEQVDTDKKQHRGREGLVGKKFVMVIDLAKCKNAKKCMHSCQAAHQLKPEQHHINVLEMEDEVNGASYFMPKPCMHCDEPQCVSVCPVDATFKRQDGLVLIDNERCIGCRFCIAACPYSARTFNWTDPKDAEKYKDVPYDVELNVPQKLGTVTKCAFSADRLREDKLPYCVSACPNSVYYFGNSNEDFVTNGTTKKTVRLSKLLKDNSAYTLLAELGTKPNVFYLPPNRKEI
ncbi:MAG: 4Fe-4S dicluster domain-containing protein [Ignavibacteriae bacterium]|nr:4Fe-4S dicluster domain-containing protein [Ignavibacteriota bacterium]